MIHGGAWMTGDKWNLSDHARQVALAGFAVMNINYRLAPKAHYPAQLEDCQAALHWMKQHEEDWLADNRRVGVWGYSAGAQLAALLTLRPQACPMDVDACVVGGTPCDLTQVPEQSQILVPVFGATRRDNPDIYREASPIHYASTHAPPMFFFHGTRDFIVPIFSSQRMHERLKELGATTEYLSIEGQGHLVTFVHPSATRAGIDFLVKHLKDR
jgi:triacylglycerol lipase